MCNIIKESLRGVKMWGYLCSIHDYLLSFVYWLFVVDVLLCNIYRLYEF
jgi:hypothetical protein